MMFLIVAAVALSQSGIPFTTVARGPISGIESPRQVTVRSQAEWETLWKAHAGSQAIPPVDFSSTMVVGVFLGSRPSGGFTVEISRIVREGGSLIVEYRERKPGPGAVAAQLLTSPFHLVTLDRQDGPVEFRAVETKGGK
jgi:hypothetical protein